MILLLNFVDHIIKNNAVFACLKRSIGDQKLLIKSKQVNITFIMVDRHRIFLFI